MFCVKTVPRYKACEYNNGILTTEVLNKGFVVCIVDLVDGRERWWKRICGDRIPNEQLDIEFSSTEDPF
jgi:hypothetical protein